MGSPAGAAGPPTGPPATGPAPQPLPQPLSQQLSPLPHPNRLLSSRSHRLGPHSQVRSRRSRRTHSHFSPHTGTPLPPLTRTHSATRDGPFTRTVYGTCLQTV